MLWEKANRLRQSLSGGRATKADNYEPHIDGIRCIAVLSVLFYHFEYKIVPGGFVGVDIFFVISGFLITRLLLRDIKRDSFSFRVFYMRRIRRLAPALIATLSISFVVAALFLTPAHFQRFSGASLASLFSVSNIYFWSESGYFDATAGLKPLLHTWSLSVEEQFYLIWPLLILVLRARAFMFISGVFALLFISSLAASWLISGYYPDAGFFLMPFRIHEFVMGAVLALLPLNKWRKAAWSEIMIVPAFLLLFVSLTQFDKHTPFPDINALLPCLAAVLLIVFGTSRALGFVLRNPLSTFIGRISYSLYLVHWPVIVLYKHISFADVIVGKTRIALLILTFVLAIALHYLVENRFRYPARERTGLRFRRWLPWLVVPGIVLMSSVHAFSTDGWSFRFDRDVIASIGDINAKQLQRREFIDSPESLSNLPFDKDRQINLLVMGDSHATDAFNALYLANPMPEKISVRRLEIDDLCLYLFAEKDTTTEAENVQNRCREHWEYLRASSLLDDATHVVVSTRWEKSSFDQLPQFIEYVRSRSNEIIVLGRTAEYRNVPSLVLKNGLNDSLSKTLAAARDRSIDALNHELRAVSESLGAAYVDKLPWLCNDELSACDVVNAEGRILYTDYGHWSMEGAQHFGARIWQDTDFLGLLDIDS